MESPRQGQKLGKTTRGTKKERERKRERERGRRQNQERWTREKKKGRERAGEKEECIPTVAGLPKGTRPCDRFTPSPTTVYVMVEKLINVTSLQIDTSIMYINSQI